MELIRKSSLEGTCSASRHPFYPFLQELQQPSYDHEAIFRVGGSWWKVSKKAERTALLLHHITFGHLSSRFFNMTEKEILKLLFITLAQIQFLTDMYI